MPVNPGWGTITLGRFSLRETFTVAEDDTRMLVLTGQTSVAGLTGGQVERLYHDLMGLKDQFTPITFLRKAFLSGYYQCKTVKATYADYTGRAVSPYVQPVVLDWELTCMRIGPASVVDIEARLSGPQTRANSFGLLGEIVHAPPVGHYGYTTNGSVPPSIIRASSEGAVTVYRQIPPDTHPRYGCDPALFGGGRVRFIDGHGEERTGIERFTHPAGWVLSNGIVQLTPAVGGGLFAIGSWTGSGFASRVWDVLRNAVSVAPFTDVSVLHNAYDTVIIRMTKALAPGRVVVDAQLRRGARTVELYVQTDTSATLKVVLFTGEPGVAGVGTVSSAGEDLDGGRYLIGSAKTATADTAAGGLSLAATTELAVFLGAVPAAAPLNSNYSFESGTTGWAATGGVLTQDATQFKYGTKSGKLVTDGVAATAQVTSTAIAITPVTGYTVGAWVRCPNGRSVTVSVDWLNVASGVISTVAFPITLPPNTWVPLLRQITSPALAVSAVIRVTITQTTPWSALAGRLWNTLLTWQRPIAFVETLYVDAAPLRPTLAGDTPADMLAQNLGNCAELTTGVRR